MKRVLVIAVLISMGVTFSAAQTTAFGYQGKLSTSGSPANGNFDFEFRLYDAVSGGTQLGPVQTRTNVTVTDGIFAVTIDFGGQFLGAGRFLDISVRPNGGGSFTQLLPRQPISSSPYSIQTINSQMLGGLSASQYVQTSDPRLTDARNPLPGSANYIQNTALPQAVSNFNVTGNGTADSLTANSTISVAGSAKPAPAPAGQGRLYFDNLTNKLRVSENGEPFVDLVGATGVGGSGTVNSIPLWSAGTTLGSSLITQNGNAIQMPSIATFAPSVSGHQTQVGTPNGETGITFSGTGARADIRYSGTLKILNGSGGIPADTNGIAITPQGNVGVGTISPTTKLTVNALGYGLGHIGGPVSLSSFADASGGWFGTRSNHPFFLYTNDGAARLTVTPSGSVGIGTTSPAAQLHVSGSGQAGIVGFTTAGGVSQPGMYGISTAAAGVGVRGDGITGVYGRTTTGVGVTGEATSPGGIAVFANGNVAQPQASNGFVKAMLHVDPFLPAPQYIVRCYNGVSGVSGTGNGSCGGFNVVRTGVGSYNITFPFPVNDRFVSLTFGFIPAGGDGYPVRSGHVRVGGNVAAVFISTQDTDLVDNEFYLIIY